MCDSCSTTSSAQKSDETAPAPQSSGGDATPEVPYQAKPRPSETLEAKSTPPAQPQPAPEAAATPAQGGAQKIAEPEEPPPPPKHVFDETTNAIFRRGVDAAANGDLGAAEREFQAAYDRDNKATYALTNLGMV